MRKFSILFTLLFLLISADHQLSQKLQQLAMTQGLGWHQTNNLTQAEIWLENNSSDVVVIDTETTSNQQEYLSLISIGI